MEVETKVRVALGILHAVATTNLALRRALVFSMVANSSTTTVGMGFTVDTIELVWDSLTHVAPAELG